MDLATLNAADVAASIEHTLLDPAATNDALVRLADEAVEHSFHGVCVHPEHVAIVTKRLAGHAPCVVSVAGFPEGTAATTNKIADARQAADAGALEVDMVMDWQRLKARESGYVQSDIAAVVQAMQPAGVAVKVILETAALTAEEIAMGAALCVVAGAAFVKTSTGYGPGGASLEDVALLRRCVGLDVGVKASGSIRTAPQALALLGAGASRLGTSSGMAIMRGLADFRA
jgi:deoxyribose-phosphate aldolase